MKIGFQGFRGFGGKLQLTAVEGLTVLTGKNSSGKSTFIKLLNLFSDAFDGVESLFDLFRVKINVANDILGGKKNLESRQEVERIKWVFSIPFEFFIDYHEVHISFKLTEYELTVSELEIFDEKSLKKDSPLLKITSEFDVISILNLKYLLEKYRYYAKLENLMNESDRIEKADKEHLDTKDKQLLKDAINNLKLTPEQFYELKKSRMEDDAILEFFNTPQNEQDIDLIELKPSFFQYDYDGNLYTVEDFDFSITATDISNIIEGSRNSESILEYVELVKNLEPNFDFEKILMEWYNYELQNYVIFPKNNEFAGFVYHLSEEALKEQRHMNVRHWYENDYNNSDILIDWGTSFRYELMEHKQELAMELATGTSKIFERYIIKFLNTISSTNFQSNVKVISERAYNIYNSTNIFSSFVKHWNTLEDEEKTLKLDFIRKYLNLFEIADDIEIKVEQNTGFIRLIKNNNLFSIIDEGSGISNILGSLLFVTQNVKFNEFITAEPYNKRILVLEEPESNLHPCLQSRLADFLVDVINKHNVIFIIETHSEYLIRKLQFLVAKNRIEPELINLNYFSLNHKNTSPCIKIRNIPILQNGSLEKEFDSGFFDEADNIAIELYTIQKKRYN